MAFIDTADLATDPDYQRRVATCVTTEALGKATSYFTDQLLRNGPQFCSVVFGPPVASSPGFGDKFASGGQEAVTDGDILSSVQAHWDRLAALYQPLA